MRGAVDRFVELFESVNNLKHELPDRHGASIDSQISDLLVQGLACFKQRPQGSLGVGGREQGSVSIPAGTPKKLVHTGTQVDDQPSGAQRAAVFCRNDCATTGRQDDIGSHRTVIQHLTFTFTEPFFAFDLKDHRDTDTTTGL